MADTLDITPRTKLNRYPGRGTYDFDKILSILHEAFTCTVSYSTENGEIRSQPMIYGVMDNALYLHAHQSSGLYKNLTERQCCICVSLCDSIVYAKASSNSSMNYRSVIIFAQPQIITDPDEKMTAAKAVMEHITPGHWAKCRQPKNSELKGVGWLRVDVTEASAKFHTGPPGDDKADANFPAWSGLLPVHVAVGEPIDDPKKTAGQVVPDYVKRYRRPHADAPMLHVCDDEAKSVNVMMISTIAFLAGFAIRGLIGLATNRH